MSCSKSRINPISFLSSFDTKPNFHFLWMLAEITLLMVLLQVATLCCVLSWQDRSSNRAGHRSPRTPRSRSSSRRRERSTSRDQRDDQAGSNMSEVPSASSPRGRRRNLPQLSLEDEPQSHGHQAEAAEPNAPSAGPDELQSRYNRYKGRRLLSVVSTGKVHLPSCGALRRTTRSEEVYVRSACFSRDLLDINKFGMKVGIQNHVCHEVNAVDQCECPRWGPILERVCCKICMPPCQAPSRPSGAGSGSNERPSL